MPNRRHFVKTVAGAAAGLYAMGRGLSAQTPARRQVMIGGRRVRVVDVHNHWDMPLPASIVKGTPYEERIKGDGLEDRVALHDKMGIDVAAVSVNDFWWWDIKDQGLARAICTYHNETLAKWSKTTNGRLYGMASIPLQFPELAAEMLQAAVKNGARGVTVGGHVQNEPLSAPRFDVFWAKVVELNEVVFMHPNGSANIIREGGLAGRGGLGNIVGNPLETTVFLSRLIFDGTFDKFPALKVAGAHGGGFLPSYLGRTEVACQRAGQNCIIKKKPSDYMKQNIIADTMVFSNEGVRHLVAEMGPSQVVFGTDIPFNWPVHVDLVVDHPTLSKDRKSTRLNSSHGYISYAVFCYHHHPHLHSFPTRRSSDLIIKKKPSDYMKQNIIADTMVFSNEGVRHLVAEMGPSQVVFGTDIPFNWPVHVDLVVDHPTLSNADKEAILGGTLVKLLRLPAAS